MMTQWEYKSLNVMVLAQSGPTVNTVVMDERFNNLGEHGWEMVAAVELSAQGGASREVVAIFKRERLSLSD